MTDTQKAAQEQKMQMMDALEKVKAETVVYEKRVRQQTVLMDKNKKEIMSCEKKMTDLVEDLIRDLREHERIMKAKFAEIYEAQQKHHATQVENFELVLTQLKSCVERGESIVQRNISAEILQTNQAIIKRCEELLKARKPDIYKPSHVNYMVEQKVKILDRIVVSATDPSLSLAEVASLKDVREKTKTNFTIVTRNSDEEQCYQEEDVITVNILNPTGDQLETEIEDTKDGKYTVTYTPQCVGKHRVEIQVNGQPLTGSPWVVKVIPHQYQFAFQFGSGGKEQGQFSKPCGIAVNDKSRILAVANAKNERVQMFGFDGNFLREFALKCAPVSLAFTESGDLLVRDLTCKILLFTQNGQFIRYIGGEHVKTPYYVSVVSDGRIITSDCKDQRIKVLTADGKDLLQSFKAPGCGETPDCFIYHKDQFFASFSDACLVMVFNIAGEHLHDIGSLGSGDGQFSSPIGLAIDKWNRLIVCDTGNRRLQLFTLDGKYITQIAGSSFKGGDPHSAVISNTGYLFVTDTTRECVHVFR